MLTKVLFLVASSAVALGATMPGYPPTPTPHNLAASKYAKTGAIPPTPTNKFPDVPTPTNKYPDFSAECTCSWRGQTIAAGSSKKIKFSGTEGTTYGSLSLHHNGKLVKTLAAEVFEQSLIDGYDVKVPEDIAPGSGYSVHYVIQTCPDLPYGTPCHGVTAMCKDITVAPCDADSKTDPYAGAATHAGSVSSSAGVSTASSNRTTSVSSKTIIQTPAGAKLVTNGALVSSTGILFGDVSSALAVFVF